MSSIIQESSIIQRAFLLEACANVPGIYYLLFQPEAFLEAVLIGPATLVSSNQPTILLTRMIGAIVLALTPQLLFALPDSVSVAGQRKLAYLTLGTGEAALIPLLLSEAFRATDAEKIVSSGGLSKTMALVSAANIGLLLSWRVFVWAVKPHWFAGNSKEAGKTN